MRNLILIVACAVLLVDDVASQEENSVKIGTFPYMAFIYHPNQPIDDGKFIQGAVLIRSDWLISSSSENKNTFIAFPEKTLLARLGAIGIDQKFNLNEDEDEQEREVIRIIRPSHTANDTNSSILLLKTLFPFNITLAVQPIGAIGSRFTVGENCIILFYAKRVENRTEERILTQMSVELLPSSVERCGQHFRNNSMVCATSTEEKKYMESDYCQDYSGGPLICGSELTGIQIYVDSCKQPYLYQLLNAWDDLIQCATEENCQEEQCANICATINKDPIEPSTLKTLATEEIILKSADELVISEAVVDLLITPTATTTEVTQASETTKTTPAITIIEEEVKTKTTMSKIISSIFEDTYTPQSIEASEISETEVTEYDTKYADMNVERKANVEAQQHKPRSDTSQITLRSFNYLMYTSFVIICIT